MTLKNQPSHVPDWVWDEYQQIQRMHAYGFFEVTRAARRDLSEQERDISTRIIADKACATVWNAIEKRKSKSRDIPEERHAQCLFAYAKNAFVGPDSLDRIPHAKRAELGKKVAKLADELQSALTEIHDLGGVPYEIVEPLNQALHLAATGNFPKRLSPAATQIEKFRDSQQNLLEFSLRSLGKETFFTRDNTVSALAALATGARAWRETKPLQVRAADGEHVYFVKAMCIYFNGHYETPLRRQVADLTNCLYGTHLSDKDVQKLDK